MAHNTTPAFPRPPVFHQITGAPMARGDDGMTLRDYFAAKAVAALIQTSAPRQLDATKRLAEAAYIVADAMLAARKENS